ncbi:hypothetical protein [Candidatus Phytoplasma prunorum]|uniref:hypothetical protein n=1 Tax=Candidatus Phytoplasma prunorum TaxID=47565 RepID=UPI002FEF5866
MWGLTFIFSVFNYIWLYLKVFTHENILERRCNIIQIVIFTTVILFALRPIFNFLTSTLMRIRDMLLSLFFKKNIIKI